ncbi:hypothetical protein E3O06_12050 [Cryobacterium glaciale]|uniref:Uncharacterized protein n=1 Tax=Cryobacterium glaciale TaxID=1259145 RepID=A0A4R8UWG6_9MICO|nr:hypothetical protein [Cryobacterium glaciale]TFB71568.1 hypothetical protein E3O06_12050 [Cryobacterium glaciale]
MTLVRAVRRIVAPVSLSPFVSLLALAALLFAVFAFHSEATGHAMQAFPAASATASQQANVMGVAAVAATSVVDAIASGSRDGTLDCALFVMTCMLLLTLVIILFVTRLPAMRRRLLDTGGVTLGSWRSVGLPIHRPSLTLLSISRV